MAMTQEKLNEALLEAAKAGDLLKAHGLIASGAQIDAPGEWKRRPLHWAASNGHLPVVEFLLQNNAQIDSVEWAGMQPLHFAAENGHVPVAACLLQRGAGIDRGDFSGRRPLHYAAWKGQFSMVKMLLEMGADPAARTNALKPEDGNTPSDFADRYPEIRQFLKEWMAPENAEQRAMAAAAKIMRAHWRRMARRLPQPGPRL